MKKGKNFNVGERTVNRPPEHAAADRRDLSVARTFIAEASRWLALFPGLDPRIERGL